MDGVEIYGSRKNVSDGDLMCGPDPGDSNEYTITQLPRPSVIRTTLKHFQNLLSYVRKLKKYFKTHVIIY